MKLAADTIVDGRYKVVSKLGSGGMADVYLAEDQLLGRRVALKILHQRFAEDREFVDRFRREASSAAGLQHPNVVGVYDRGRHDGTYYIAMEYLEGSTLKDLIVAGEVDIPAAIAIVSDILAAARFAHRREIIHRDLKPQNVIVDAEGRAKVTDFGIAKAGASDVTQTGSVMGTAHYLSPEQAQGLEVGEPSDLYSVGVILYEALTGRVPFEGDSAVAVALKQVSDEPIPPSVHNPSVWPALDAVALRALAKRAEDRYQTADEFLDDLSAAATGGAIGPQTSEFLVAPPPERRERPPRRRRRGWIWALALAAIVALAIAIAALADWGPFSNAVKVPDVTGEPVDTATRQLEREGLQVSTRFRPNGARENTVLEQDPVADSKLDEGRTVRLTVSAGPKVVKIPGVGSLPTAKARRRLRRTGFEDDSIEIRREYDASMPRGLAIGTEPPAGERVISTASITLIISRGAEQVTVPDVTGEQRSAAEGEVRAASLVPSVSERTDDAPAGQVISQSPSGGSQAARNSTVSLVVSSGPKEKVDQTVTVPDVTGSSPQAARGILVGRGLTSSTVTRKVDSASQNNTVIGQNPGGGSQIKKGGSVSLVVGEYTKPPSGGSGGSETTPDAQSGSNKKKAKKSKKSKHT